jgi:hypothetical protein
MEEEGMFTGLHANTSMDQHRPRSTKPPICAVMGILVASTRTI